MCKTSVLFFKHLISLEGVWVLQVLKTTFSVPKMVLQPRFSAHINSHLKTPKYSMVYVSPDFAPEICPTLTVRAIGVGTLHRPVDTTALIPAMLDSETSGNQRRVATCPKSRINYTTVYNWLNDDVL